MLRISSRWFVVPAAAIGVCAILFAEPADGRRNDTYIERIPASSDPAVIEIEREEARKRERYALRIDYKERLIHQLIEGKTTLDVVADEFLRLNQEVPSTLNMVRLQNPDVSDEEASALNVIEFVIQRVEPGKHHDTVMNRIGVEFRKHYGHDYKSVQ